MNDKLTLDKWRGEFCLLMALQKDIDLTIWIKGELVGFECAHTTQLWWIYYSGRMHERCAAACAVAQVRMDAAISRTNWHEVNNTARG